VTSSSSPAATPEPESAPERDSVRLDRVVRADYRFIWRLLRRFGVPQSQAEDAAQQVFLIVAERLQDIAPGRERSFAFGTALRLSQSLRRRSHRELPSDSADERSSTAPAGEELLDQQRARAHLEHVLASMPLELRTVLILFELEAMTSPEIAVLVDVPLGTVASRLRRARALFRSLSADRFRGAP
jgi:RNA polymerase sigma-70 factor (ECF subfamily)